MYRTKNHNYNKLQKSIPGYSPMELLRSIINIPSRIEKRNICDISYIFQPLNMHYILVRIEIDNTMYGLLMIFRTVFRHAI